MPGCPHLQAESELVKAICGEVDFCPFREPGACLSRKHTIPLLTVEINPACAGDQEQAYGPQHEADFLQKWIDGLVARCAIRGRLQPKERVCLNQW